MTMKRLLLVLLSITLFIPFVSCKDEIEIETNVKYTVYENEGTDMVSFYMTSDKEADGEWRYSADGLTCLEVFYEGDQTEENASYRTLILSPSAEGEDTVTFTLDDGRKYEYLVKTAKDKTGIMRITVEEAKE